MFGMNNLSTFNPKQISGIKLWLDAANVSNGSNPANSTAMSTWTDLSGVSGNAVQSTGGLQPTFKTAIQNGLPGIQFSGAQSIDVASLAIGSNISLFTVTTSSSQNFFMEQSSDTNSHDGFYIFGAGGDAISIRNAGSTVQAADTNWSGTSCVLLAETYDGTTIRGYKNGTQAVSQAGSISNATITDKLYIGSRGDASLFMTGYIHEIILYSGLLSTANQSLVNDYLRRKWAIY